MNNNGNKQTLQIYYANAQSIRNKLDDLHSLVKIRKFEILALSETWLYSNEVQHFNIDGFTPVHACRTGRAGGVSLYIKNEIKFKICDVIEGDMDFNFVSVILTDINQKIGVFYRPPRYDFLEFLDKLQEILTTERNSMIVVGDFNVDLLDFDGLDTINYKNMIQMTGFEIANTLSEISATRISYNGRPTILDHVLNKKVHCYVNVLDDGVGDHRQLSVSVKQQVKLYRVKITKTVEIIDYNRYYRKFENLSNNETIDSIDKLVTNIQKSKSLATKQKVVKFKEGSDWISGEFLDLIKERNKLYKKKKNNPNDRKIEFEFKKLKNFVNNKKRILKTEFFAKKWNKTGNDLKKQWKFVNFLIYPGTSRNSISSVEFKNRTYSNQEQIVDVFNQYFTDIGVHISDLVKQEEVNNKIMTFREIITDKTMHIRPTDSNEILHIVLNLKKNVSPGHDNITVRDLVSIQDLIIPILVRLINNLFLSGEYPQVLKIGKVTPVHKSGDKTNIQNYRPITSVDTLSKIVEILLANRIIDFLSKNVGFDKYQYGFVKKSSTLSATTDFVNYINTELDEKKYVIATYIDLNKAFDVVNLDLLLRKLKLMGIRGITHELLRTYLKNRLNFVSINGINSKILQNRVGVPQGSVLGPLLFSLYILSLKNAEIKGKYFIFADDMVLLSSHRNIIDAQNNANKDLLIYYNWLLHNNLKLNESKTVYMLFKQKNTPESLMNIQINNHNITRVTSTKYLGLVIDDKLTWTEHIQKLHNKITPMIGALFRCTEYLNNKNRYLIYNAYILSNLRYLLTIWGTCNITNFKRIQTLQNKATKTLFRLNYRTPTDTLYKELNLNPLPYILKLEQCKQVYNILTNNLKCNTTIIFNDQIHNHNTRTRTNIHLTNARTNRALLNPLSKALETYNDIPIQIRESQYRTFLKKLKLYLNEN